MSADVVAPKRGLSLLRNRNRFACMASFACVWLWCCLIARTDIFSIITQNSLGIATMAYPTLIGCVAVLVLCLPLTWKLTSFLDSKAILITSGVLFAVGSSLVVCGQEYELFWMSLVGGILGGGAIALLKIAWGEMFSRMQLQTGLAVMGSALLVSLIVFCGMFMLPPVLIFAILIVSGTLCPLLLFIGTNTGDYIDQNAIDKPHNLLKPSWTFMVLPALVAFTYSVAHEVITLSASGVPEFISFMDQMSKLPYLTTLSSASAEMGAGLILLFVAHRIDSRSSAAQIYAFSLIFVVVGYLFLAFQIVPLWLANAIVELGFSIFYFFMIVFWSDLAKRMDRPIIVTYAVGYLAFQGASLVGYVVAFLLIHSYNSGVILFLTMTIILAFFAGALFLYGGLHSPVRVWLMADSTSETTDDVSEACAQLSRTGGLSSREHEVLVLLGRGRNAAHIAHSLSITRDTVRTHIKSIYRKLDTHSQQELINSIDELVTERHGG